MALDRLAVLSGGKETPVVKRGKQQLVQTRLLRRLQEFDVGGAVRVMEYVPPANPDTGDQVAAGLGNDRAVLLPNHGVIAVGESLKKAFGAAMAVEESAQVAFIALQLGTPKMVPDGEVERMNDFIHHKYGQR